MFNIQELIENCNPLDLYTYLVIIYIACMCYAMLLLSMIEESKKWRIYIVIAMCSICAIYYFKKDIQINVLVLYRSIREML